MSPKTPESGASTHLGKPSNDLGKVVASVRSLLFAGQNTGRINKIHATQDTAGHLATFEAAQEGNAESFETSEWQVWVDRQGVSRDRTFFWSINQHWRYIPKVSVPYTC